MNENWEEIGNIGNHDGGLAVMAKNGKYFWSIETHFGYEDCEEIPQHLYEALIEFKTENAIHKMIEEAHEK